jgi:uncharacterized protein YdaU (DUF1376 family)
MGEKVKVRRVDLYADEWLAGTSKLGPNEGWVYVQICMLIYSHNGPIRDDEKWLARLCNMHWRAFRTASEELQKLGKIRSKDGYITVKRCSEELQRAGKRLLRDVQNGLTGGRPSNKNNDVEKPHAGTRARPSLTTRKGKGGLARGSSPPAHSGRDSNYEAERQRGLQMALAAAAEHDAKAKTNGSGKHEPA